MAYVSLYRKYRPQTFAEVMGQEHVTRTLQNALRAGRIAHGYLFTGTRGTAKTTVARLLAKALNCDTGPAPEPCNRCDACRSITEGACIDVIEMDAASHRGVADIEEVRKAVGYGPMQFRYKVFIIDEAHQLSSDAKDAFLKTLEEPPGNVVFILATTEPQSIPITIRSRCQQFDFKRGSLADIAARLRHVLDSEGVAWTPEAVNLVARSAEGSWRDALSLLEQVLAFSPEKLTAETVNTVLGTLDSEMLARVTDVVARRDAPAAFALAGQLLDAGKEARTLLRTLSGHFRDLLLVSVGGPAVALELTPEEVRSLQEQARRFAPTQMMRAMEVLNEAQGETRWNNQHRLLVELTFLKLMNLGETGGASTFATAPIVFPAAAPAVPVTLTPVPSPDVPLTPPPTSWVPASPAAGTGVRGDAADDLPPSYFAPDADADETGDDEDDYVPTDQDEPAAEPVAVALPAAEPEEPEEEDADLFGAPAAPAVPAQPAPALADASRELAAMMTPGRAPAISEAPDAIAEPAGDGRLSLDRVLQAWPRFLQEAERISKQAAVMLEKAVPTDISGKTIAITFTVRMNYEMMSLPKKQEFVRKLLARTLGLDSVAIRYVLDTNAVAPPRPAPRSKVRRERDLVAALDAPPPDGAGEPAHASPPPSIFAAPAPPRAPAPRAPAPATNNGADGGDAAAKSASQAAALEDPFVQEALSIFGGEIVSDG